MVHDNEECFFNNKAEEEFLFSLLKPDMTVFEWGSGASTFALAKRVERVISIEHDNKWYCELLNKLPQNVSYRYVPANFKEKNGSDGTYGQYKDYVDYVDQELFLSKVDLFLVDGRARVHCAERAINYLKPNDSIVIHDIFNPDAKCDRPEYWQVLNFLHPIAGVHALWQFKPKYNL